MNIASYLPARQLAEIIDRALEEDLGNGDVTTSALVPPDARASAEFSAREPGILAGVEVALAVMTRVDASVECAAKLADGDRLEGGETIARVSGSMAAILMAERTALNFIQRMSGIATASARYVSAVEGTGATIVDTRKTAPVLRSLDKYAVVCGGARNHRRNLSDGVLIKDNHIATLRDQGMSIQDILKKARLSAPHTVRIEIEVENLGDLQDALAGGADIIMLDNMSLADMREAVRLARGRCLLEASGGVSLNTVRQVAETGVDLISVGALTHSVKALDIGLDYSRS